MVTTTQYDAAGNANLTSDPMGRETYAAYNMLGQTIENIKGYVPADMVSGSYTGPGCTQTVFNSGGQIYQTIDGDNNATTYHYDGFGRVQEDIADAAGNVTAYSYNLQDETTAVTDPMGRVTTYSYDALGQQIATGARAA